MSRRDEHELEFQGLRNYTRGRSGVPVFASLPKRQKSPFIKLKMRRSIQKYLQTHNGCHADNTQYHFSLHG